MKTLSSKYIIFYIVMLLSFCLSSASVFAGVEDFSVCVSYIGDENTVSVTGKTEAGVGKHVALAVWKEGAVESDYPVYVKNGISGFDGAFSFNFSMPDLLSGTNNATGTYCVYLAGEEINRYEAGSFAFVSSITRDGLIAQIQSASSASAIGGVLDSLSNKSILEALEFDFEKYLQLGDLKTEVLKIIYKRRQSVTNGEMLNLILQESEIIAPVNIAADAEGLGVYLTDAVQGDNPLIPLNEGQQYYKDLTQSAKSWVNSRLIENRPSDGYSTIEQLNTVFGQMYALFRINNTLQTGVADILKQYKTVLLLENNSYYQKYDSKKSVRDYVNPGIAEKAAVYPFTTLGDFISVFQTLVNEAESQSSNNSGGGASPKITSKVSSSAPVSEPQMPVSVSLFADLESVPWAKESIEGLAEKGILEGDGKGNFYPDDLVSREQFVKMLVEALGLTDYSAVCEFNDVSSEQWYYPYVATSQMLGISNGTNDGNFGTGMNITRQEMAAMAYRALLIKGTMLPRHHETERFADEGSIDGFALEPVEAMQRAGIIQGMGNGRFAPKDYSTRAQAAKIIYGLMLL